MKQFWVPLFFIYFFFISLFTVCSVKGGRKWNRRSKIHWNKKKNVLIRWHRHLMLIFSTYMCIFHFNLANSQLSQQNILLVTVVSLHSKLTVYAYILLPAMITIQCLKYISNTFGHRFWPQRNALQSVFKTTMSAQDKIQRLQKSYGF